MSLCREEGYQVLRKFIFTLFSVVLFLMAFTIEQNTTNVQTPYPGPTAYIIDPYPYPRPVVAPTEVYPYPEPELIPTVDPYPGSSILGEGQPSDSEAILSATSQVSANGVVEFEASNSNDLNRDNILIYIVGVLVAIIFAVIRMKMRSDVRY